MLREVYTPSAPIDDPKLFSGRADLLTDLRNNLATRGANIVLYGERGVGKTSLWKVLLDGRPIEHHIAAENDDFISIFVHVLRKLGADRTTTQRTYSDEVTTSIGKDGVAGIGTKSGSAETVTPVAPVRVDLNFVLDQLGKYESELDAIVIDEFQAISNPAIHSQITEVVKGIADRKLRLTIVIVGVADDLDTLLKDPEHRWREYKGRHLFAYQVPQMSNEEVRDIIDLREQRFRVAFHKEVKSAIVRISSGYPATAHRLALDASLAWVTRGFVGYAKALLASAAKFIGFGEFAVKKAGIHVEQQDLRLAVERSVREYREHHRLMVERYEDALSSPESKAVECTLATLASVTAGRMAPAELATRCGLNRRELTSLAQRDARGLIEHVGNDYRLADSAIWSFIESRRFLAGQPEAR